MQKPKLVALPQRGHSSKHNLPEPPTMLIGREREVAAARALLQRSDIRLLTLTGAAGVGKTRLALQVAAELADYFADGVYFVALASIDNPDLVLPSIAQKLDLKEKGNTLLADLLKTYLHDKLLLLFLDNFEQVVKAAPALAEVLEACPALKILVTSREVLHLRAEQQFLVLPLALPNLESIAESSTLLRYASVELFLRCAQTIMPEFQLTDTNAALISAICTRLDGLPLAIELAAAQIKFLSPKSLLVRLDRRLQVLNEGYGDLPRRQQTLRATLQWSYDLLSTEEQRLFRMLSVFVGGCSKAAIEALCTATGEEADLMFNGIKSLLDKSLLQQFEQSDGERRLLMLETIREFALESFRARDEADAIQRAHAFYYLALVEEIEGELYGSGFLQGFDCLEQEHGNIRAALSWFIEQDEVERAARMSGALSIFWSDRGHLGEGRRWYERVLAMKRPVEKAVRAKVLSGAGRLMIYQGEYDLVSNLCEESHALFQELGDRRGIVFTSNILAYVALARSRYKRARAMIEANLPTIREVGDRWVIGQSMWMLGIVATFQGDYVTARSRLEECLEISTELGNIGTATYALSELGKVALCEGNFAEARSLLEQSLTNYRAIGDRQRVAYVLSDLGELARQQGDYAGAQSILEESVAGFQEVGDGHGAAFSLGRLGRVAHRQGNYDKADTLHLEALATFVRSGERRFLAASLEGLAETALTRGYAGWAVHLWGAAEALREGIGEPMPPVHRSPYEQMVAIARTQLGKQAFETAWAEGRAMSPDHILAEHERAMQSPQNAIVQPNAVSPLTPHPSPVELRQREKEVLRLVAHGLTNVQIAEQMVISHRTVNWYLTQIYRKLGVSSRSAATRYAIEHHFV
jgi:predicted ATPase/DNA-binding CsgD family transcriptional regulator